jgi:hypothetical protein
MRGGAKVVRLADRGIFVGHPAPAMSARTTEGLPVGEALRAGRDRLTMTQRNGSDPMEDLNVFVGRWQMGASFDAGGTPLLAAARCLSPANVRGSIGGDEGWDG